MTATNQNESRAENLTIDYSAPLKPTEAVKVGEVEMELNLLAHAVEEVCRLVDSIGGRLGPILSKSLSADAPPNDAPEKILCEMASRIRKNRETLLFTRNVLNSINERIEI